MNAEHKQGASLPTIMIHSTEQSTKEDRDTPKLVKDAPVFVKGEARGQVHYPTYESIEDAICLPPHMRDELAQQHRRFRIYPSGSEKDGLISDFVRRTYLAFLATGSVWPWKEGAARSWGRV